MRSPEFIPKATRPRAACSTSSAYLAKLMRRAGSHELSTSAIFSPRIRHEVRATSWMNLPSGSSYSRGRLVLLPVVMDAGEFSRNEWKAEPRICADERGCLLCWASGEQCDS